MARKTIPVKEIVELANYQLGFKENDLITKDYKAGICMFIGKLLIDNGSYHGFVFNNNDDCEIETFGYFSRKYILK